MKKICLLASMSVCVAMTNTVRGMEGGVRAGCLVMEDPCDGDHAYKALDDKNLQYASFFDEFPWIGSGSRWTLPVSPPPAEKRTDEGCKRRRRRKNPIFVAAAANCLRISS